MLEKPQIRIVMIGNWLPEPFVAVTLYPWIFVTFKGASYPTKYLQILFNHECIHAEQQKAYFKRAWFLGSAFFVLRYAFSFSFRKRVELEAYTKANQLSPEDASFLIDKHYRFNFRLIRQLFQSLAVVLGERIWNSFKRLFKRRSF